MNKNIFKSMKHGLFCGILVTGMFFGCMFREGILSVQASQEQEICELVVETVTIGLDNPGLSLVEEAVNQITEPAIGVRIRLLDVGIQQHAQKVGQMIESGGQLDLVTAGLTYPAADMAADGLLLSLEDLAQEYGQDLIRLFGEKMKAGYFGDTLYAIPSKGNSAMAGGILYNKAMADQLGITMPDPCTLADLDGIFAKVHEKLPGVYGTAYITREVSLMNFIYPLESYGSGVYSFGVTFDPWKTLEIVNLYESEQYRDFCFHARTWQEQGYLPSNLMTSSVLPAQRLSQGQIFCLYTGYSPATNAEEMQKESAAIVRSTETISSTGLIQERMWAIPVSSRYPQKAMEFLNLLYTNSELANLLMNGIEGIHYTRVSQHVIACVEPETYHRVFTEFGDQKQVDQWYPATEDTLAQQIAFEEEAHTSLSMGYAFDSSGVEREVEAVKRVIASYAPALECGMIADVEEALKLFQSELKKAGIDRIIEENRRQLELWMAEQGH